MARSKSGGTRGMLSGRVASDVYSNGKNAKGKKQQNVRSLAETVANPRTVNQNRQRMILRSASAIVSLLKPIISHSFDGVPSGQPSVSLFRSAVIAAYKQDVALANLKFGYLPYGVESVPNVSAAVSQGRLKPSRRFYDFSRSDSNDKKGAVSFFAMADAVKLLTVRDFVNSFLCGDRKAVLTLFAAVPDASVADGAVALKYVQVRVPDSTSLDAYLGSKDAEGSAVDPTTLLHFSANFQVGVRFTTGSDVTIGDNPRLLIYEADAPSDCSHQAIFSGSIVASMVNGKWCHNTSTLSVETLGDISSADSVAALEGALTTINPAPAAYVAALASYPIGEERFLNGGSISGGGSSPAPSPEPEPEPEYNPTVTKLEIVGASGQVGGFWKVTNDDSPIIVTVDELPKSGTLKLQIVHTSSTDDDKFVDFESTRCATSLGSASVNKTVYLYYEGEQKMTVCRVGNGD